MAPKSTKLARQLLDRFFRDAEGQIDRKIDLAFTLQSEDVAWEKAEPAMEFLTSRGLIRTFEDAVYLTDRGLTALVEDQDFESLPKHVASWPTPAKISTGSATEKPQASAARVETKLPRPLRPRLSFLDPEGNPHIIELGWAGILGRSPEVEISVPDPRASKKHAELKYAGDAYVVKDLGAANGTMVNGAYIDLYRLQHGDVLLVGRTELLYECPKVIPEPFGSPPGEEEGSGATIARSVPEPKVVESKIPPRRVDAHEHPKLEKPVSVRSEPAPVRSEPAVIRSEPAPIRPEPARASPRLDPMPPPSASLFDDAEVTPSPTKPSMDRMHAPSADLPDPDLLDIESENTATPPPAVEPHAPLASRPAPPRRRPPSQQQPLGAKSSSGPVRVVKGRPARGSASDADLFATTAEPESQNLFDAAPSAETQEDSDPFAETGSGDLFRAPADRASTLLADEPEVDLFAPQPPSAEVSAEDPLGLREEVEIRGEPVTAPRAESIQEDAIALLSDVDVVPIPVDEKGQTLPIEEEVTVLRGPGGQELPRWGDEAEAEPSHPRFSGSDAFEEATPLGQEAAPAHVLDAAAEMPEAPLSLEDFGQPSDEVPSFGGRGSPDMVRDFERTLAILRRETEHSDVPDKEALLGAIDVLQSHPFVRAALVRIA